MGVGEDWHGWQPATIHSWLEVYWESMIDSGEQYDERRFTGLQLPSAEVESAHFTDCVFEDCDFSEARLSSCRWADCTFRRCDLSLVDLSDSAFSGVRFEECKLVGVNWTLADWDQLRLDDRLGFKACNMNHSTFIGLKLPQLHVIDCQASNLDFRGADLCEADFSGSDLTDSLFGETDLRQADFRKARNYSISPLDNKISGAAFSLPEAMALLYHLDISLDGEWEVESD